MQHLFIRVDISPSSYQQINYARVVFLSNHVQGSGSILQCDTGVQVSSREGRQSVSASTHTSSQTQQERALKPASSIGGLKPQSYTPATNGEGADHNFQTFKPNNKSYVMVVVGYTTG